MQKLIKFAEGYAEWIVLGVAGIYVLAMFYIYWLTPPASGTIQGRAYTAGEIDQVIADGPATDLQAAFELPNKQPTTVPAFAESHGNAIAMTDVPPVALDMRDMFPRNLLEYDIPGTKTDPEEGKQLITGLPKPPAAVYVGASMGFSVITRPVTPVAGARVANPAAETESLDTAWISVGFKLDPALLEASFSNTEPKPLDVKARRTQFLRLVVERQEVRAGKPVGTPEVLEPLLINPLEQLPPQKGGNKDRNIRTLHGQYRQWAERNTVVIRTPPFYPITGGDPWYMPGEEKPVLDAPPDANRPRDVMEGGRAKIEITPRKPGARPGQREQGPPGGMPGQVNRQPRSTLAPGDPAGSEIFGSDSPDPPVPDRTVQRPMPGMFPGGPNNPNGAEAGVAGANVVGMFAPADVEGEIFFWAHDDTAVPGRAYRYRAKYLIQNPLFGSNLAAEENRDIFYLESAWSQWTDLVAFPSLTQLYVVSGVRQGRSSVTLEVFTRQGGKVRSRSYEVSPGDLVGAVDGLINFGTDWTVVDVRKNAKGEYYVLLMNADGELERRTFNGDQADLEFQRLRDEALRVRTEQQAAVPR